MKKLIAIATLIVAAASFNVGCKASASVHGTDARKLDNTQQVAYTTTPAKK